MRLIDSNVELLQQGDGINGVLKQIEIAGRTCYKSENKTTKNSSVDFVKKMIASGHYAMLEHGTVYLYYLANPYSKEDDEFIEKYKSNPYTKMFWRVGDDYWEDGSLHTIMGKEPTGCVEFCITTNYRVIVENNWEDDLQYLCEPTPFHYKRYTLRFTTDRGVSHKRFVA